MFGDVTFAQTPFAALSGNTFFAVVLEASAADEHQEGASFKGGNQEENSSASHTQTVPFAVLVASQAEQATATDTAANAANILNAVASEGAAALVALANTANMLAAQAESTSALAAPSATAVLYAALAEQVTGTDAFVGSRLYVVSISEGAAGSDTAARVVVRPASVAEQVSAAASLTKIKDANVYPAGVQLVVNVGGVLIWAEVIDTQNPNWTQISS